MSLPPCPQCASEYTYEDGGQYICPECAHEWNETESAADLAAQVRDANGAALQKRRHRHPHQRPQGKRQFDDDQTRYEGQRHTPAGRRSQHRLQNRRQRDEFKIRIRQKSLTVQTVKSRPNPFGKVRTAFVRQAGLYARQPLSQESAFSTPARRRNSRRRRG